MKIMKTVRRELELITLALITCLALQGCGDNAEGSDTMKPTMTQAEANRKVDEHIKDSVAQLPGASLRQRLRFEDSACTDPDDNGPQGRVFAERDYEIAGIDSAQIPHYFDALKKWWRENNFRIVNDKNRYEFLSVENTLDSIGISLQATEGHLFISASSPCVWPNGTPEPSNR